ncbi:unnamed protein product [Ilex paraguariensis]|uniref:Uncharacterized protein n=1 Tax=Ilex paraguariensis TaxID=185542 RepID=A0ABC8UA73_9AQUA
MRSYTGSMFRLSVEAFAPCLFELIKQRAMRLTRRCDSPSSPIIVKVCALRLCELIKRCVMGLQRKPNSLGSPLAIQQNQCSNSPAESMMNTA